MSELIILLAVAAVVAVVWVLTKLAISSDGYGRRRPPISHAPDMFDAGSCVVSAEPGRCSRPGSGRRTG